MIPGDSWGDVLCLGDPCCCLFHCPTVPACQGPGHGDRTHMILYSRSNQSGRLYSLQPPAPNRQQPHASTEKWSFHPTLLPVLLLPRLQLGPHWVAGNCHGGGFGYKQLYCVCRCEGSARLTRCDGLCSCNSPSPIPPRPQRRSVVRPSTA